MSVGNVIVGQSGGPTSVINSSLAGVFQTARDRGAGIIYGMKNGIAGFLEDRYINGLLWKQIAMIEGMSVATVHRYKEAAFEWIAQVGIIRAMEGCGTAEG